MNNNRKSLSIIRDIFRHQWYILDVAFVKIVDCIQPLTNFPKHFILGVPQGYEYVSDKTKQNPNALLLVSQIRIAISSNFFHFFIQPFI